MDSYTLRPMQHRPVTRTVLARLVASAALLLVASVAGAGVASAHDDEGQMTVTKVEQTGPTTVAVEVGIVYSGDGHLAEEAKVSARLTGADGTVVGPVDLDRQGESTSLYAAEVQVPAPGTWTVDVSSTDPAAEATGAVEVEATPDTGTDGSTTSSTLLAAEDDEQVFTTQGGEESTDEDADASGSDDESGVSLVLVIVVVAVAAVLLAGGGLLVVNRRGAGSAHDHTHDGPPPPDQMPPA